MGKIEAEEAPMIAANPLQTIKQDKAALDAVGTGRGEVTAKAAPPTGETAWKNEKATHVLATGTCTGTSMETAEPSPPRKMQTTVSRAWIWAPGM